MPEDKFDQLNQAVELDFEVGDVLKNKIIPEAVRWFTGDADDEDFHEDDEDDEGLSYEDEEESDESEDEPPRRGKPQQNQRGGRRF